MWTNGIGSRCFSLRLLFALSWFAVIFAVVEGRRRLGNDAFQCFKCEEDSEKPKPNACTEIQTCSRLRRPVCAKLDFSAFFHGVMGTRTLKFCYDLVSWSAQAPLCLSGEP